MGFQSDGYEKVARGGARAARRAFIWDMDDLSVRHAGRNVDPYRLLLSIGTTNSNRPGCAAVGLFERNADLGFQIATACRKSGTPPFGAPSCPAEHTFKEVAEVTKSAETAGISEIDPHIAIPIRRWSEICSRFPVLPEGVILFSFLRIRQDAVG